MAEGRRVTPPDRKERDVRALLEAGPPGPRPVPPDLAARAALRGARLRVRRRLVRTALWTALLSALLVLVLWAVATRPWEPPPMRTTPVTQW